MIRINLLSAREIKAEIGRRQDLTIAALALGATLGLILVVLLYQLYRTTALSRELASTRQEIAAMEAEAREVTELQKKVGDLKQKVKVIEDLRKKKVGPVRVMESLSGATPPRLWLTEFKETSGNLSMNGIAVDNQTVADFLKALSSSDYFKNVELVETSQSEQDKLLLKKFSVRSRLVYQPSVAEPPTKDAGAASPSGKVKKP
ncbi:MAG: PilN domain-containing protein [Candidatus Binatia bacterium]